MKQKKYIVKTYFSGFCTNEISANNIDEAILLARELPINKNEILSNLENWEEADTAENDNKNTSK